MEGSDRRVLVVDDDKNLRDLLTNMLSLLGFEAAVASTGDEGLRLFFERPMDFVITDLNMPGMDGWTLAFQIKKNSPKTPVVLITGSERRSVIEKLNGSGIDAVMFKPFGFEAIKKTVKRLYRSRFSYDRA